MPSPLGKVSGGSAVRLMRIMQPALRFPAVGLYSAPPAPFLSSRAAAPRSLRGAASPRDLYANIVLFCVISTERKRAEKSLAIFRASFIQFVWQKQTVSDPRAAGQRPVRLRGAFNPAPFFGSQGAQPLQCERIAAGGRPRSPQAERSALPLQASKAFTSLQGDTIVTLCHPEPCEGSLLKYRQN